MCMLCSSFKKGELTILEAWSNYTEMVETMEPEHIEEVYKMLTDAAKIVNPENILSPPTIEDIRV